MIKNDVDFSVAGEKKIEIEYDGELYTVQLEVYDEADKRVEGVNAASIYTVNVDCPQELEMLNFWVYYNVGPEQ